MQVKQLFLSITDGGFPQRQLWSEKNARFLIRFLMMPWLDLGFFQGLHKLNGLLALNMIRKAFLCQINPPEIPQKDKG